MSAREKFLVAACVWVAFLAGVTLIALWRERRSPGAGRGTPGGGT